MNNAPNHPYPGHSGNLPDEIKPKVPESLASQLREAQEALGAALRLTRGAGEYDNQGAPLDSDAETEKLTLNARQALDGLLSDIQGSRETLVITVLRACEDHLSYDASVGFVYEGVDEAEWGNHYEGRFHGAFEAASALVEGLDKAVIIEQAGDNLINELRNRTPVVRDLAASGDKEFPEHCPTTELESLHHDLDVLLHRRTVTNAEKTGLDHFVISRKPPPDTTADAADYQQVDTALTEEVARSMVLAFTSGALPCDGQPARKLAPGLFRITYVTPSQALPAKTDDNLQG